MNEVTEKFRTLYCDPGEDFGWCQSVGTRLISAGTEKMWLMVDDILAAVNDPTNPDIALNNPVYLRDGVSEDLLRLPIGRIVCEDWRLYPDKLQDLAWDECRTARAIGAITLICRMFGIPLIFQGANIKPLAQAAGCEEFYYRPLRENRHQNDAIQHFVYFTNIELMELPVPRLDSVHESEDAQRA